MFGSGWASVSVKRACVLHAWRCRAFLAGSGVCLVGDMPGCALARIRLQLRLRAIYNDLEKNLRIIEFFNSRECAEYYILRRLIEKIRVTFVRRKDVEAERLEVQKQRKK